MGLSDVLNGMKNGPRGGACTSGSSDGMSPITMGLLAFLAISSYATCCPLDPRLTEDELALTLRDLKVVALVDTTDDDARVTLAPDRDGAALQPA